MEQVLDLLLAEGLQVNQVVQLLVVVRRLQVGHHHLHLQLILKLFLLHHLHVHVILGSLQLSVGGTKDVVILKN